MSIYQLEHDHYSEYPNENVLKHRVNSFFTINIAICYNNSNILNNS